MGMQINTNIAALNAHRNLSNTQNDLSKSLEKLSSGLRINRAADDAAGLAITEGLRRRGIDVLTAFEDGRSEADDEVLLQRATDLNRIFVSQDQDLLRITTEWMRAGRPFAGVAFGIQQDLDIGGTIEYQYCPVRSRTGVTG